jgi:hypothetical protein
VCKHLRLSRAKRGALEVSYGDPIYYMSIIMNAQRFPLGPERSLPHPATPTTLNAQAGLSSGQLAWHSAHLDNVLWLEVCANKQ